MSWQFYITFKDISFGAIGFTAITGALGLLHPIGFSAIVFGWAITAIISLYTNVYGIRFVRYTQAASQQKRTTTIIIPWENR